MGTETHLSTVLLMSLFLDTVKLNNPLMGTETTPLRCRRYSFDLRIVKLNNPHKGTAIGISPIKLRCKY